jgi:hypothetical protein
VSALKLNVDFGDADLIGSMAPTPFGDLRVCGISNPNQAAANGQLVRSVLASSNIALGGGSLGGFISYVELSGLLNLLNNAFEQGTVSPFAQTHLVDGACP